MGNIVFRYDARPGAGLQEGMMEEFSFEVVRRGEASAVVHVLQLPDGRAIWRRVEALALGVDGGASAFIRVRNSQGATVVRAGVATAIASIEKCSRIDCPLKRELQHRCSNGRKNGGLSGQRPWRPASAGETLSPLPCAFEHHDSARIAVG